MTIIIFRRVQILPADNAFFINKLAIELAHLIGFESVAAEFPLVLFEKSGQDDVLCFKLEKGQEEGYAVETAENTVIIRIAPSEDAVRQAFEYVREHFSQLTHNFQAGSHEAEPQNFLAANAKPIAVFDRRPQKGLESLFDKDYLLLDENHDLLPDRLDAGILLHSNYSKEQVAAACNIAARLGLETTSARYPITCTEETADNLFLFRDAVDCSLTLEETDGKRRFVCEGNGRDLLDFSSALCETFPLQKPGWRWLDLLNQIASGLAMQTVDGQLAWLESYKDRITDGTNCYFSPGIESVDGELLSAYQPTRFQSYKGLKKVHEKEYDIPWEVDICKSLLEEKLWKQVLPGDKIEILAVLSEDKSCRKQLAGELEAIAEARQAQIVDAQIICAYKQGFSWLEEVVLPALLRFKEFDTIEISFKPFLPPGVSVWQDEDGATPTYNNIASDNENKWYDLPIRYLQELYPIDDILSAGLGIGREQIVFVEYRGERDITYEIKAIHQGTVLHEDSYKAVFAERNFLDAYPGMGKVHPGTGWLRAAVNGKEVISERIVTDVERVWQIYQEDILPYCKDYCDGKSGGKPAACQQPFFSQMRLDLFISEPNERLNCREDIISSLDSLHEDFYFAGLDFFKMYGNSTSGEIFDAPGLILPVIENRPGKPTFKFTLYDQLDREAVIDFDGEYVRSNLGKKDIRITIRKLLWNGGKLNPVISVEGPSELGPVLRSYVKLLSEHKLFLERHLANTAEIRFEFQAPEADVSCAAMIRETPESAKDLRIEDIDILEETLIGYEQYLRIIEQLKRVPGISVYQVAESYLGREIYAIELLTDYRGYVSRTKLVNQNPVLYINARHHANEVSGTNGIFMLLRELLTKEEFNGLARQLNLVVVPFENADGAAIHYELQKTNPTWKLHIARFNAIGKEFYYEHFKDETIHTEAYGLTKLWRNWLPDVMSDNHGVPTHEWEQQFSGYTSPSYKGFWLPRSLLYGYFWTVKDECFAGNIAVAKKMEGVIAEIIGRDREIEGWNREWQDRFDKYAHKWMPRLFPADYYKNMINYWIPFDYDINHRYPSVRYPWITTVAYTSEVADETAQGGYLNLAARAHVLHDIATIRMLRDSKCVFQKGITPTDTGTAKAYMRQRPVIPNEQV